MNTPKTDVDGKPLKVFDIVRIIDTPAATDPHNCQGLIVSLTDRYCRVRTSKKGSIPILWEVKTAHVMKLNT